MKKSLFLSLVLILIFAGDGNSYDPKENAITITTIYDNYIFTEGPKTDWGYSCIIEGKEKTILFDAGTKGDILFSNINKLKVNPKDVELVVISHIHLDHTGGLLPFLDENNKVTVYLPVSFPDEFVRKVKKTGAKVVSVDKPVEICEGVFLTEEMGGLIKEQSLIVDTSKGLVVLTGCAHPGIVGIVKRAKEVVDKEIYLVCGGFHLLNKSEDEVNQIISQFKELGVRKVGATHCTGDKAIELFKKAFKENFVQMGVGKVIKISE
ncbi:MAG: MBL fold metallo-hydrolase [Candidatus Aminicenantes bacterium]|nr:MBL fold metallo-hydrolase [Candidatus Aminicenantes bacterium]